jgi:hypothetical protein
VADRDGHPDKRKILFAALDETGIEAPSGGSNPLLGGAMLQLFNRFSGVSQTLTLPAGRWVEKSPGRFRYTDRDQIDGPCKSAMVEAGTLKAICRGDRLGLSLAGSPQGSLDVTVRLGAGPASTAYCARFGGMIVKDTAAADGATGAFKARDAPASAACGW